MHTQTIHNTNKTKSFAAMTLLVLSGLSMSQTVYADELKTSEVTMISTEQNTNFSATTLINSVQAAVEQQVDAQLNHFVDAVSTSLADNLDTIVSAIVNQ